MKKIVWALFFLLLPVFFFPEGARSQMASYPLPANVSTMQSNASANQNGNWLDVKGAATAVISIVSSVPMSGGTVVNFEATPDETIPVPVWNSIRAYQSGAGETICGTTSADGNYRVNVAGYSKLRARISGYSAGTTTITGYATSILSNSDVAAMNPCKGYTRVMTQTAPTVSTVYTTAVSIPLTAQGATGFELMLQAAGTCASRCGLKVLIWPSNDGINKIGHVIERYFAMPLTSTTTIPSYATCAAVAPYIIIDVVTDLVVPTGGSAAFTLDWLPINQAVPIADTVDKYGSQCSLQGGAENRYRGMYTTSMFITGATTTANQGIASFFVPSTASIRAEIKAIDIQFQYISATVADATARYLWIIPLSGGDATNLTAITMTTVRPADTLFTTPWAVLRTQNGGATVTNADATFTRPIEMWILPNTVNVGGSTFGGAGAPVVVQSIPQNYHWPGLGCDCKKMVFRPNEGMVFATPVALTAGYTIVITITWYESA